MRIFHFTTVVSKDYIYKFLAMEGSLRHFCKNYKLFVLCVDQKVYKILNNMVLQNVTLIPIKILENANLLAVKANRSFLEYCWTLKPYILHYIMLHRGNADYYAHLDADLFFYANLEKIIEEKTGASLFLTDHNNSESFLHTYRTSGRFNTGFVCVKNDATGQEAAAWWKARCLERCSATADVEKGIFGDQRYVEKWPELFSGVHVIETKGANVAQWNIEAYDVQARADGVYVNEDKLIFYHFSGLSILDEWTFSLSSFNQIEENALQYIYMPYITKLSRQVKKVRIKAPGFTDGFINRTYVPQVHHVKLTKIGVE